MIRSLQSCQVGKGGVNINQFNHRFRSGPTFGKTGRTDDEGHLRSDVKKGDLTPDEMIAQVVAMIRSKNDNGVVPEILFLETIQDQAELSIDEAYTGMIGLNVFFS